MLSLKTGLSLRVCGDIGQGEDDAVKGFAIFTLEKKVIFGTLLGCSDLQSPYIPPRVHKGVDVALAPIQSFRRRVVLTPDGFITGPGD
jgi:hypothetical protein